MHGLLHLLGYDHATPDEHSEMFGIQGRLLLEWQSGETTPSRDRDLAGGRRGRLTVAAGLLAAVDAALSSFSRARAKQNCAKRTGRGSARLVTDPRRTRRAT